MAVIDERPDEDLPWYGRFTTLNVAWACRNAHAGPRGRGEPRCSQDGFSYHCRCENPFGVRLCNKDIPRHAKRGQASVGPSRLPLFCERCGGPHPWTRVILRPYQEKIQSDPTLSDEQKALLLGDIESVFGKLKVNLPSPGGKMNVEMVKTIIEIAGSISEAVAQVVRASIGGA